jgi:hypothetical protein
MALPFSRPISENIKHRFLELKIQQQRCYKSFFLNKNSQFKKKTPETFCMVLGAKQLNLREKMHYFSIKL